MNRFPCSAFVVAVVFGAPTVGCSPDSGFEPTVTASTAMIDLDLERFAWSHRPLLVFASDPRHESLVEQRRRLQTAAAGLSDRDIVVIEAFTEHGGTLDGQPITPASADRLWEGFRPTRDGFTVLLVGKDTGEKGRWSEPVTIEELFALIDAMPMRRNEMNQQP